MSEDCLYLNIWSPVDLSEPSDELKPVLFWIHGGALIVGSSVEQHFSGHVLASKGDVVVVTINYRVNTFGFLYTGTDDAPGNVGLWDQTMALEWVNENIRYFGGDPNKVTIFGESAGGWSTSLHVLSPVSRNLFQNEILMSGASINRMAGDEPQNVIKNWLKGAHAIGCSDSLKDKFTPDMKKSSADKLAAIPLLPDTVKGLIGWMSEVVIDGQFLPNRPLEMLESGDFKKSVNLLVGTVEDDESFILRFYADPIKYDRISPKNISYSEAYSELIRISEMLLSKKPINGQTVAKVYFNGLSDNTCPNLLRRTIGIAIEDYLLSCPSLQYAKTLYESDKNSQVFQYYFTSKLGNRLAKMIGSDWMGSAHTDDIFYFFGVPFYEPSDYTDEERDLSERVIEMISTFAKTGKMPAQNGTQWHPYYSLNGHTITSYYEIGDQKKDTNFGFGLKTTECEYLWKLYIDLN